MTGAVLDGQERTRPAEAAAPSCRWNRRRPGGATRGRRVIYMTSRSTGPKRCRRTYKIRWPESDHAFYITINDIDAGRPRPPVRSVHQLQEHGALCLDGGADAHDPAVFRRGGDVSFVVEELKAVFDPRGGQWIGGHYVPSLLAAIGEVIERHMIAVGFLPDPRRHANRPGAARRARWSTSVPPACAPAPNAASRR